MKTTHIPATPDESAAILAQVRSVLTGAHLLASTGVTLYVHGGGFEYTNPDMERLMTYRFSLATGRPAVRVEYRLAPEYPYPAALEDLLAAYHDVLRQGAPPSRVLLMGESAGATLILSALLALKEAGGPLPGGAVVISPQTDFTLSSPSIEVNGGQDIVNRAVLDHVRTQYLAGADPAAAPQSPLHGDLIGLPPVLIMVGSREVMLDDARRFAEAASAAGGEVQLDIYEGMRHAFHAAVLAPDAALLPTSTILLERITEWCKQHTAGQ
jgi:epsilon-lactone hydrolase